MLDSNAILQLYASVLQEDIIRKGVSVNDIKKGVQDLANVYALDYNTLQQGLVQVANYNIAGHRCAYLHKYAAFHTVMVLDMMNRILEKNWNLFQTLIASEELKICSLGGGPGCDVIGVIVALCTRFDTFRSCITVVDYMEEWRSTFASVISHLAYGNYGKLKLCVADNFLQWNYIGANLLGTMTNPVNKAISQASFVTMVKFISAAACQKTGNMIKKIFRCMKPGALLLYIDNAGGGFHGLITRAANEYRFITVFGPLYHHTYLNENLKTERFGYTSCFTTTVTVHLLLKPQNQQTKNLNNIPISPCNQNSNTSSDAGLSVEPRIKTKIKANTNNFRSSQHADVPVCHNMPIYTNQSSASQNNFNKSLHINIQTPINFESSGMQDNELNQYNDTAVSSHGNRTNTAVSAQYQSDSPLDCEDDSDGCCTCCVIS